MGNWLLGEANVQNTVYTMITSYRKCGLCALCTFTLSDVKRSEKNDNQNLLVMSSNVFHHPNIKTPQTIFGLIAANDEEK